MSITEVPIVPVIVGLFLLGFAIAFIRGFLLPALKLDRTLDAINARLDAERADGRTDLTSCFSDDPKILSIWKEFKETLHVQREMDLATGEMKEKAVRSTVPAEAYLSTHAVVDARVHTEFFKHLPGIFTGIGIIGTFSGLLTGLRTFQISEDSGVVRNSLTSLLHGVSEAFLVSASAILLAMLATVVEKFLLNRLYGKLARLTHTVDEAYVAGAGEEYLARLVNSSEESASQTRILKDALVSDLKEILTDLAERQIEATNRRSGELGASIAGALTEALKTPLDQIAGAVGQVSQDQSSAVTRLLTDVLASFSERLENMFGSQLSGIGDMQQRTVDAMQTAVAKLQELTANVEAAGTRTTDAMASRLEESVRAIEARQAATTEELRSVLGEIRSTTGAMQAETQERLQGMLAEMAQRMTEAVTAVEQQAAERSRQASEEDSRRVEQTVGEVGRMRGSVDELSTGVAQLLEASKEMAEGVERTTRDAFARLNGGADTLLAAASRFEASGREAAGSFDRVASVTSGLADAAGSVAGAARGLDGVVADHRVARDSVAAMVESLRGIVETASKEASITADVLGRIEGAAQRLAAAQAEADGFLDEVVDVIEQSHLKFAEGMKGTVNEANRQFHKELTSATGLLKDAIQELENAVVPNPRQAA